MELTTAEKDKVDAFAGLNDYTKSHYFAIGLRLLYSGRSDEAIDSFKRGATNNSCVCCMFYYSLVQHTRTKFHLSIPIAIESAIRGHMPSMNLLLTYYSQTKPAPSRALVNFWKKKINDFENKNPEAFMGDITTEEKRKENKKVILNHCFICSKEDSKERTFNKCGICKLYSYCGKECQSRHWKKKTGNHMAECRHLMILKEYFKPRYATEIRQAIIAGDNPKDITRLQALRTQLGLNRPKEDYEELLLRLSDDNMNDISKSPNRYEYLVARKDGTVNIGSTPNII